MFILIFSFDKCSVNIIFYNLRIFMAQSLHSPINPYRANDVSTIVKQ